MDIPVTTPPPTPKTRSFGSTLVRVFKGIASLTGSTVRILFNTILVILLVIIITGIVSGGKNESAQSRTLYGTGNNHIAVINLTGEILDIVPSSPLDAVSDIDIITPRKVLLILEKIRQDSAIKAVILRINSPGGSVTASDEIFETIMRFKAETNLPVIASLSEVAASGGYYIALAADTIIASPTTITGSIGVIANTYNFKELADKYGVKEISIKSGNNKNFLSPLQEPSSEEQAILKSIVDEAYGQFVNRVATSRKQNKDSFIAIADGRPLSGTQAEGYKLIDKVGSFHDSVEYVRDIIKSPDAQVVEYGVGGLFENLLQGVMRPFMRSELRPLIMLQQFSGRAAYLYLPF